MPFSLMVESTDRALAGYKLTRITDGDTPFVEMPIRMLSIDAPEVRLRAVPRDADDRRHARVVRPREPGRHGRAGRRRGLPPRRDVAAVRVVWICE